MYKDINKKPGQKEKKSVKAKYPIMSYDIAKELNIRPLGKYIFKNTHWPLENASCVK